MKTLTHWRYFFQFLKKPNYLKQTKGIKNKSILAFNSLLLEIVLILPLLIIYGLYTYYTGNINESLTENIETLYNPFVLYAMVAIFEELSFRGFLTKFNPILFSTSVAGILSLYYKKIVFSNMFFEPDGLKETAILFLVLFFLVYLIGTKYKKELTVFWNKNFGYIVYISAFIFAFAHFFNSKGLELGYLKTIIFQLIGAFIMSFVRVRAGILYAIIIHFVWDIFL
ncbi:type II CAAX prenyl endopeptidase Rce1 family protein [Aquimarina spinulae]|uniref:CPBP family glutamic-type intramembrane protease n=1 Tax=Aquimarina spinulae TaxID=1192023 RepID=UPI000D560609|nr:CPBP family glutamic-type intramembrane protease [Aquimarina spinulae]